MHESTAVEPTGRAPAIAIRDAELSDRRDRGLLAEGQSFGRSFVPRGDFRRPAARRPINRAGPLRRARTEHDTDRYDADDVSKNSGRLSYHVNRRKYRERPEIDMNCLPGTEISPEPAAAAKSLSVLVLLVLGCSAVALSHAAGPTNARVYGADYSVRPDIARGGAHVELRISQNRNLLRQLSMPLDAAMISDVAGDGLVSTRDGRVHWEPPAEGGELRWFAKIDHLRIADGYDAMVSGEWALFRAEDVIPPTATRTLKGSVSRTTLVFDLPDGWSAVTEYFRRSNVFNISNPDRRFDRPTGWIVLGDLGVRHETIAGVRVVVAAPVGHGVRRMDILAMLRWTLPELVRLLPDFPRRLTIVAAGDPMWRGGLSAPASFYVHAERPLISENGTSTIMHEALHVGLGTGAVNGADWIVEGLAEYYSLEILRRSGTIGEKRYRTARSKLAGWAREAKSLCADPAAGAVTARAVTLLAALDSEISSQSDGKHDLDDVVRAVAGSREKISAERLRDIARDLADGDSAVLSDNDLNNCEIP